MPTATWFVKRWSYEDRDWCIITHDLELCPDKTLLYKNEARGHWSYVWETDVEKGVYIVVFNCNYGKPKYHALYQVDATNNYVLHHDDNKYRTEGQDKNCHSESDTVMLMVASN